MAEPDPKDLSVAAKMYWAAEGYTPGGVIREVDYSSQNGGVHPLFQGIKIVDCDTHITEAPDLFTSRAPAKYKDKVPHLRRDEDGVDRWYCSSSAAMMDGALLPTPDPWPLTIPEFP